MGDTVEINNMVDASFEGVNLKLKKTKRGTFELDLEGMSETNPTLLERLIEMPILTLKKIREKNKQIQDNPIILKNVPKSLNKSISELRAKDVGKLVNIQGTIKSISFPTSRVSFVKYSCSKCGTIYNVPQDGVKIREPRGACSCGSKTYTEISRSIIDTQEMEIEEFSEGLGARQPQTIRLLLEGNLVDTSMSKVIVGNRLEVLGILENSPNYITNKEGDRVLFDYLIRVISFTPKEGFDEEIELTDEDIKLIKEIASNTPLTTLADNIAPNISGLDHIKKAAVLFMAKGVTKETFGGEKRRGFIHILVIGEGGLAKSTILQNIQKRHFNVRIADGKDATKAGIVASVVQNKNTGKWSFEAGELVLANEGILLLDEIDKLPQSDRQAMHRPMEQGEAVLSKASIKVTLQCNTGIFAAGNPKFGEFKNEGDILEQVDISPTLLSRFDLVFLLKDEIDNEVDRIKAKKILGVHSGDEYVMISPELFKKYIYYISNLKPKLSKEAAERIEEIYVTMREKSTKDGERVGMPIGPRHLEGLIRLSEAHAKIRLSESVDLVDVEVAEDLFKHSLSDFGLNPDKGIMDLSSLTTTVKSSKRDRYLKVLAFLKEKAADTNEFIKRDIYSEVGKHFNLSYAEVDDIFSMLHREGDIYESSINKLRLVKGK